MRAGAVIRSNTVFIPLYGISFLIRFLVLITKYTVLDEQWRETKGGNRIVRTHVVSLMALIQLLPSDVKCTFKQIPGMCR